MWTCVSTCLTLFPAMQCKDLGNKKVECVEITNPEDLKYYKEKTGEPSDDQGVVGIPTFIKKEVTSNVTF